MDMNTAKAIIENILFIADRPLTPDKIGEVFNGGMDKPTIKGILEDLKTEYQGRGIQLLEIAEGYQLCTRTEYSEWVKRFYTIDKGSKLSQASLETLSIIAYKQPITRVEIEEIRGVDSGGVVKTLLEKSLARNMGRKKVPGRPMMYGTTRKFLEYFGLKSLADLPTLTELKEDVIQGELKLHETARQAHDAATAGEDGMHEGADISSETDEIEDVENYGEQGESNESGEG
ncbi:MAG: SMC-Scp complex subunit ScpB [Nitrospinae bacterium]|nr:SMC-Scp complex subunit ScpB [Nitrospinota bacterium]MBI3814013.1 SMC-Scp complex subunit ScpB [Nitrospinota bacterium]